MRGDTYSTMVNRSLNQVLMRSINTSFVALLPVASLLVRRHVRARRSRCSATSRSRCSSVCSPGAYSSIFVATPVLAWLKEREPRYRALRARADADLARGPARPVSTAPPAATAPATHHEVDDVDVRRALDVDTVDDGDEADVDEMRVVADGGRRRADDGRGTDSGARHAARDAAAAPPERATATAALSAPAAPSAAAEEASLSTRFVAAGRHGGSAGASVDCPVPMSTTEPRVDLRTDRRSVLPWRRHHPSTSRSPRSSPRTASATAAPTPRCIEQAFELARERPRRAGPPLG